MKITPTILVSTYDELKQQIKLIEPIFNYVQLDIMDGKFVKNKSFNYNEKRNAENFFNKEIDTKLKFELHLMVEHPLKEIQKWKKVKNIWRVIFHIESQDDAMQTIAAIRKNGWQSGLAIKHRTSLSKLKPYQKLIDVILFMTVKPGAQGNDFAKEAGEKIKKFRQTAHPLPTVAIDGGVNTKTIKQVKSWGVDITNIGSALIKNGEIKKNYNKLKKLI